MTEEYLIRKNGYWYRPNAQGYTLCKDDAGRFSLDEAVSYSHPNGPDGPRDGITYEPAPAICPMTGLTDRERIMAIIGNSEVAKGPKADLILDHFRDRLSTQSAMQSRIEELEEALREIRRVGDDKMAFRSEWLAACEKADKALSNIGGEGR